MDGWLVEWLGVVGWGFRLSGAISPVLAIWLCRTLLVKVLLEDRRRGKVEEGRVGAGDR